MSNLVVAFFCVGIVSSLAFFMSNATHFPAKNDALGAYYSQSIESDQYVRYRNLAIKAGGESGVSNGILSNTDIGMTPVLTVNNRIASDILYIWAELDAQAHNEVVTRLGSSRSFGYNRSGFFSTSAQGTTGTTIPGFVPDGSSVTIIQLN